MRATSRLHSLAEQASTSAGKKSAGDAVRELARATIPELWINSREADAPSYGTRVFLDSGAALRDLANVKGASSQGAGAAVRLIVGADRDLAKGAISQARGGNHELLVAAERALVAGGREAASGAPVAAVRSYTKAWESAFEALTQLVAAAATSVPSTALATAAEEALGSKKIALAGPVILQGQQPLTLAGKPELFFAGSEACPFCGVQRWGMIVALSQFGTFSNLHLIQSVATERPQVRTFTFFGSSYRSPYISFKPVEVWSNVRSGFGFSPLQALTAAERALVNNFDPPAQTPFIDVANRFINVNSTVHPDPVGGISWTQIASSLRRPTSTSAQAVAGAAEVLTAELCGATNGNPASICSATVVKQYEAALPFLNGTGGGCPPTPRSTDGALRQRTQPPRAQAARCNG